MSSFISWTNLGIVFIWTGDFCFCFVFESCNEQIFLFLSLRSQFGSKPGLPLSSVKPAVVYGHWCGQLTWLCSSPAQSLGGFPWYLPVHSFQRSYGREVHDGPHSNLLWAGRMPERLTHSLIKVSGKKKKKTTWEKSVIKRQASIQGQDLETVKCGSDYPLCFYLWLRCPCSVLPLSPIFTEMNSIWRIESLSTASRILSRTCRYTVVWMVLKKW